MKVEGKKIFCVKFSRIGGDYVYFFEWFKNLSACIDEYIDADPEYSDND